MKIKIATGFLILAIFVFTVDSFARRGTIGATANDYTAPELYSPVTSNIDLSTESNLKFKWRQVYLAKTDHYEFRLYKGYETIASTLILKQNIPADEYPFELPADNFEINQVYTWTLKQVYINGQKSDRAFSAFKIIKK